MSEGTPVDTPAAADGTIVDRASSLFASRASIEQVRPDESDVKDAEQVLETHEILELTAFIERKAWIEEKIQFLESLPPVGEFAGLDEISAGSENVLSLATRQQLEEWYREHDRIEKETEIFDTGDLKKLKKFTKAATQRNLSPDDTDLIELTLTTLYTLDKLIHLLRDRSEQLELLDLRLLWEEQRSGSWQDRRTIIHDMQTFLSARARWSPSVYADISKVAQTPPISTRSDDSSMRRSSIDSDASESSAAKSNSYSRSRRSKFSELLSREAVQIASKVTTLKLGKVATAATTLDKLLDASRKAIPDPILDEQDRLEEKCIKELEQIGKFAMTVVMQWKMADEIYVETKKDQVVARDLILDIEASLNRLPANSEATRFLSLSEMLFQRLSARKNTKLSSFLHPAHTLFPDQEKFNDGIIDILSAEHAATMDLCKKLQSAAKDYHSKWLAIKACDDLQELLSNLMPRLKHLHGRLQDGDTSAGQNYSVPDLHSPACLDPTASSAYLATFPSLVADVESARKLCLDHITNGRKLMAQLRSISDDQVYINRFSDALDLAMSEIEALLEALQQARELVSDLSQARNIWRIMKECAVSIDTLADQVKNDMTLNRWKQQIGGTEIPLTPQSPCIDLSRPVPVFNDTSDTCSALATRIKEDISVPLEPLLPNLLPALRSCMLQRVDYLNVQLADVIEFKSLSDDLQHQSAIMGAYRDQCHVLETSIEEIRIRLEQEADVILATSSLEDDLLTPESYLHGDVLTIGKEVRSVCEQISTRVLFVSSPKRRALLESSRSLTSYSFPNISSDILGKMSCITLPFDPLVVDNAVRADVNSYSLRLAGSLKGLEQHASYMDVCKVIAKLQCYTVQASEVLEQSFEKLSLLKDSSDATLGSTSVAGAADTLQQCNLLHEDSLNLMARFNADLSPTLIAIRPLASELRARRKEFDLPQLSGRLDKSISDYMDLENRIDDLRTKLDTFISMLIDSTQVMNTELERNKLLEQADIQMKAKQSTFEIEQRRQVDEIEVTMPAQDLAERAQTPVGPDELQTVRGSEEPTDGNQEQLSVKSLHGEEVATRDSPISLAPEAPVGPSLQALEQCDLIKDDRSAEHNAVKLAIQEVELQPIEQVVSDSAEKSSARKDSHHLTGTVHEPEAQIPEAPDELAAPKSMTDIRSDGSAVIIPVHAEVNQIRDVFDSPVLSRHDNKAPEDALGVLTRLKALQKRLSTVDSRAQHFTSVQRASAISYPTHDTVKEIDGEYAAVATEITSLASESEHLTFVSDLGSLRSDMVSVQGRLRRLKLLARMGSLVHDCDAALSDLLEHIDSYPAPPCDLPPGSFTSDPALPPEEQLTSRVNFSNSLIRDMNECYAGLDDDPQASVDQNRLQHMWNELADMSRDRISGSSSRPVSAYSSGRNSRSSLMSRRDSDIRRSTNDRSYLSPTTPKRLPSTLGRPAPPLGNSMRLTASPSAIGSRSVSGPLVSSSSNANGTTFASRQRTTSLSSNYSLVSSPAARISHSRLPSTPTGIGSSRPRVGSLSKVSMSQGTWARSPRMSISEMTPGTSNFRDPPRKRQYIANPRNQLDVAVGDVVNKLPVSINVEVVADTWKDQSGKYWIGDSDPKLCFCRILRSQTVMVRVGGGWTELSKFIKDHFADLFRVLPESPPRNKAKEEKWISSATVFKESTTRSNVLSPRPMTPDRTEAIPSLVLRTPEGRNGHTLSTSSPASPPLTPLQFLRKAGSEAPMMLLSTPTKASSSKSKVPQASNSLQTPARMAAWRP